MSSRIGRWQRELDAAVVESADRILTSTQNWSSTSSSQVMRDGQMVAISTRTVNMAPPQITRPSFPCTTSETTPASSEPSSGLTATGVLGDAPATDDTSETDCPQKGTSDLWSQFETLKGHLANLLYHHHSNTGFGTACSCRCEGAIRTVRCSDCWHRVPTCEDCFITAHTRNPTHWAEVWDKVRGYTIRCDISRLPSQPHIQLGHSGESCPNSFKDELRHEFLLVDINGIHSTRLRFCTCNAADSPVEQLMKAQLFPATFVKPKTAFTFSVLKHYHIHHLESAESAYSFIASLRRATDAFFFNDAADPYDQFRDTFKMWMLLVAEKRYGHHHNIDSILVDRPPGHLAIGCPTCPQQNINTDRRVVWPKQLRHLKQIRLTLDGNYHANHLSKTTTDSNMVSFFAGRAFFSPPEIVKTVLDSLSTDDREKPTCSYLKAISKQETKKFIGCDISGIVNVQCPHVFIISTVDLIRGEKFGITDLGCAQALRLRYLPLLTQPDLQDVSQILPPPAEAHAQSGTSGPSPSTPRETSQSTCDDHRIVRPHCDDDPNVTMIVSYDIVCSWHVNVEDRMQNTYPDIYPFFETSQYTVPLLHIQNHKDNCTYLHSSAFTTGAGHFHGETAEHPWVYVNQFGGQGRQMSHGNRHDC